jgi:hypothetical protein
MKFTCKRVKIKTKTIKQHARKRKKEFFEHTPSGVSKRTCSAARRRKVRPGMERAAFAKKTGLVQALHGPPDGCRTGRPLFSTCAGADASGGYQSSPKPQWGKGFAKKKQALSDLTVAYDDDFRVFITWTKD